MASSDQSPILTVNSFLTPTILFDNPTGEEERPPLTIHFKLRDRPCDRVAGMALFPFSGLDVFLNPWGSMQVTSQMLSHFRFADDHTASVWLEFASSILTDTINVAMAELDGSGYNVIVVLNIFASGSYEEIVAVVEGAESLSFYREFFRWTVQTGDRPPVALEKVRYDGRGGGEEFRDESCAICLNDFCTEEEIARPPPCSHLFHLECLCTWTKSSSTCPLCRCDIPLETRR